MMIVASQASIAATCNRPQRDLSIAGMYIQSRQHHREIYQSPACIYNDACPSHHGGKARRLFLREVVGFFKTQALSEIMRTHDVIWGLVINGPTGGVIHKIEEERAGRVLVVRREHRRALALAEVLADLFKIPHF